MEDPRHRLARTPIRVPLPATRRHRPGDLPSTRIELLNSAPGLRLQANCRRSCADFWRLQMNKYSDLTDALQILVGERFSGIGQAAGMGVFEFGALTSELD